MGCSSSSAHDATVNSAGAVSKPSLLQVTDTSSASSHTLEADDNGLQSDETRVPIEEEKPGNIEEEKAAVLKEDNRSLQPPAASSSNVPTSINRHEISTQRQESSVVSKPISSLPPLKKGFILKEGHLFKNWKNRFFVLEAGTMIYYESSTDTYPYGVRKKGEIILKGTTAKVNQNIITISFEGDAASRDGLSTLTLEIRYPTEREEWFQAIKSHIAYFSAADLWYVAGIVKGVLVAFVDFGCDKTA